MLLDLIAQLTLFAEAEAEAPKPDAGGWQAFQFPLLLIGMFVLLWLIVLRPRQKEEENRRKSLLASIKKNDRVVTIGGIIGVVMNVHREAEEVTIRVDETNNTKLRMQLAAIARVISSETEEEKDSKNA